MKNIKAVILMSLLVGGFPGMAKSQGFVPTPFNSVQQEESFSFPKTTINETKKEEIIKEVQKKKKPNPVLNVKNKLGVAYAENIVEKAEFYLKESNYNSAKNSVNLIEEWLADATEGHMELYKSLKKLGTANEQAIIERNLAIKFATMRDRVLFVKATVLIKEKKAKQAIESLVEIIRSQPNTKLGFSAYKLLQDIGFTYPVECRDIDEVIK